MKKILVANRGEIALRVMKTCRRMGIKTVAVYSDVDRQSPHVLFADEAICIGPAPSSESYLKGELIIQHALALGVDGIHPDTGEYLEPDARKELHKEYQQKLDEWETKTTPTHFKDFVENVFGFVYNFTSIY